MSLCLQAQNVRDLPSASLPGSRLRWRQGAVVVKTPDEIRIAIIDGHELFIEGMRAVIGNQQGMTMIGHAADRLGALEVARLQPDVILMELVVGEESSLEFLPDLRRIAETSRILIVTGIMNQE